MSQIVIFLNHLLVDASFAVRGDLFERSKLTEAKERIEHWKTDENGKKKILDLFNKLFKFRFQQLLQKVIAFKKSITYCFYAKRRGFFQSLPFLEQNTRLKRPFSAFRFCKKHKSSTILF